MSPNYKGQPKYVVVGYLNDLLEPWSGVCPGDEWGEFICTLCNLLSSSITLSYEDRALVLVGWLLDELNIANDEQWWDSLDDADEERLWEAQDRYEETTKYWRERAKSFKGEAVLEETIAGLPNWVKPDPNRPPKPDPERREYDRLKAKFDQGSKD